MKLKGNKKSKRTKLSLKYNIQKRVREHKRRVRKEAKKLGVKKKQRKDPGIPNTWPFKAEMLQELERKKEKREKEIAERKEEAKKKAKETQQQQAAEAREAAKARDAERRAKRATEVEKSQRDTLRRTLLKADVLIEVLDARDPLGCRCVNLEAWARESGKRVVFVLAKADLVAPQVISRWLQVLGQNGPVVAVQVEAGRDGVDALLRMLGHPPHGAATAGSAAPALAPATAAACVGYPGVGKRSLARALRREVKGQARWLLESVGRLRPEADATGTAAKVHLAVRGALPTGRVKSQVDAVQTVRQLLERADRQTVMRRYRLPAFDGPGEFLSLYARDRELKNRRGAEAGPELTARRVLADLPSLPGCVCLPPGALGQGAVALWEAHGAGRPALEAVMQGQVAALNERATGPTAGAVTLESASFGPEVDVKATLADEEEDSELAMEAGEGAPAAGDSDGEGEEEEEDEDMEDGEEDLEGEESEEEGESDGMED